MERPHSVENLVLNSTNNLHLSSRGETGVTQGDGLGSSRSAILAAAVVGPSSSFGILGGETEEQRKVNNEGRRSVRE